MVYLVEDLKYFHLLSAD